MVSDFPFSTADTSPLTRSKSALVPSQTCPLQFSENSCTVPQRCFPGRMNSILFEKSVNRSVNNPFPGMKVIVLATRSFPTVQLWPLPSTSEPGSNVAVALKARGTHAEPATASSPLRITARLVTLALPSCFITVLQSPVLPFGRRSGASTNPSRFPRPSVQLGRNGKCNPPQRGRVP